MESQLRPDLAEAQASTGGQPHAVGTSVPQPALMPMRITELILRLIVAFLTLMAAIVMGTARQTTAEVQTYSFNGLIITTPYTFKSTYSAALLYFVVANAIACFYSAASLALSSIVNEDGMSSMSLLLSIGDLLMVVLLFSSNGAAAAISVVAGQGQLKFAGWVKICNYADGFCARINAAIVQSMFASAAYAVLVVVRLVAFRIRKSGF